MDLFSTRRNFLWSCVLLVVSLITFYPALRHWNFKSYPLKTRNKRDSGDTPSLFHSHLFFVFLYRSLVSVHAPLRGAATALQHLTADHFWGDPPETHGARDWCAAPVTGLSGHADASGTPRQGQLTGHDHATSTRRPAELVSTPNIVDHILTLSL